MPIHKTFLFVTALAALAAANLWAADDPFIGTWKLNQDKTQWSGQVAEFKSLGGNRYEWVTGSIHTEYIGDGKERPPPYGATYSLRQDWPDRWVMTRKGDGQVTSVGVWTLSEGGQQWKRETKGTRPDGSPYTEEESLTRTGAGSGFVGTWESQKAQFSSIVWVVKRYGDDGLSFSFPAQKEHLDMKFDRKDYPDNGPRVTPGETSCAKRIDEHTIQVTDKLNGKVHSTHESVVSQDGRTVTDTSYAPGQKKPIIVVFEKQM